MRQHLRMLIELLTQLLYLSRQVSADRRITCKGHGGTIADTINTITPEHLLFPSPTARGEFLSHRFFTMAVRGLGGREADFSFAANQLPISRAIDARVRYQFGELHQGASSISTLKPLLARCGCDTAHLRPHCYISCRIILGGAQMKGALR